MKNLTFVLLCSLLTIQGFCYDFKDDGSGLCFNITSDTEPYTVEVTYENSDNFFENNYLELTTITIPETVIYGGKTYSVTSIGDYAFEYSRNLTSVTIPNSVTIIGDYAFEYSRNLISVTIPNSVTSIGDFAFYKVKNIIYNDSDTEWAWGALTMNGTIDGDFIYEDDKKTHLTAYIGQGGDVTIPNSVTSIGEDAFYDCKSLTSVTIPESVKNIGMAAFQKCIGLTSLTIPNSVTTIDYFAFSDCSGLTSVSISNSVQSIGQSAFSGCNGLTSVTIPESVKSIGSSVFSNCSGLTSVIIPNSVTNISWSAFSGCSGLTSVTIPNSVTSIDAYAFEYCSGLTSITIPNSVKSIGEYAFYGCSFTSMNIPNSVKSIDEHAFSDCRNLISVTIPNSVTSIGEDAFFGWGSNNLTIYCEAKSKPNGWNNNWSLGSIIVVWGSTGPSAISDNEATAVSIYATNNTIIVENATADIYVYDAMGRLVARSGVSEGSAQIAMPHEGIYIVKCGVEVKRVSVSRN